MRIHIVDNLNRLKHFKLKLIFLPGSLPGSNATAKVTFFDRVIPHGCLLIQSSCFLLVFFGCRERLFALQSGQMGAFLWICWWQDRHAFIGGGCCWRKCRSPGGPRLLTSCWAAAAAAASWDATGGGGGSCGSGFQPGGARSRNLKSERVKALYSIKAQEKT